VLLIENTICSKLRTKIPTSIQVRENIFASGDLNCFLQYDHILIVNSDSRRFTKLEFWETSTDIGLSHNQLQRIPGMTFLFNYIVSPACNLPALKLYVGDIRLITTNQKFFDEISLQSRYELVRHYPRLRLESPICRKNACIKTKSPRIRLGMHSLPNMSKWNEELPKLVRRVNVAFGDAVCWNFMGIHPSLVPQVASDNVSCLPAFALPVDEFLRNLDIFVFFMDWRREEAWARSAGEALASGCPVIATRRGGNVDQVVHGNNGYLCTDIDEFFEACSKLIASQCLLTSMKANAIRTSKSFSTDEVCRKLLSFLFDDAEDPQ
jgi:glycosyltransferase involved in cell wall biosynthesis